MLFIVCDFLFADLDLLFGFDLFVVCLVCVMFFGFLLIYLLLGVLGGLG